MALVFGGTLSQPPTGATVIKQELSNKHADWWQKPNPAAKATQPDAAALLLLLKQDPSLLNRLSKQERLLVARLEQTTRQLSSAITAKAWQSRSAPRSSSPPRGVSARRSRRPETDVEHSAATAAAAATAAVYALPTRVDTLPLLASTGEYAFEVGLQGSTAAAGSKRSPVRSTERLLPVFKLPDVGAPPHSAYVNRVHRAERCALHIDSELMQLLVLSCAVVYCGTRRLIAVQIAQSSVSQMSVRVVLLMSGHESEKHAAWKLRTSRLLFCVPTGATTCSATSCATFGKLPLCNGEVQASVCT
eukprot:20663-Heterococcus_DN1.PRE.3